LDVELRSGAVETNGWYEKITAPRSVALVGASDDPDKSSGRIQSYLLRWGFSGDVYPINRTRSTVQERVAYASLTELGRPVDVAIVIVPAARVLDAVRECAAVGVGVAVIGSSGFAEVEGTGSDVEAELAEISAISGMRIIGPNCNGVVALRSKFPGSFATALDTTRFEPTDGPVSMVSQSGAIGAFVFYVSQASGLGLGTFVATGNEADIEFAEVIHAMVDDPHTEVILGYVEGLKDGDAFVRAAKAARNAGKRLIVLKVGTTSAGSEAALSHTASLAGEERVYDGVFRQLHVARASSIAGLVDAGRLSAYYGTRLGPKLSVLTMSGGAGILVVDRAAAAGFEISKWDEEWQAELAGVLPSFAAMRNPIDSSAMLADPSMLERVIRIADRHPETDVIVVVLGNAERSEQKFAERLIEVSANVATPIVVVWIGGSGTALRLLNTAGVACFDDPVRCVDALALAVTSVVKLTGERAELLARPDLGDVTQISGHGALDEVTAKRLLARYGLPVVTEVVVADVGEAAPAAMTVGLPAVAKLRSRHLPHKSEAGGVLLGLETEGQVEQAVSALFMRIRELELDDADVVIARQVETAYELLIGTTTDPVFGPVVTVGIGGVLAEAIDDVVVLLPEFTDDDLDRALRRLRLGKVLEGLRNLPVTSARTLGPALRAVAAAATDPRLEIVSIDVNPLIVTPTGELVAVDALVELR
jgi:acyl-CoA synthetase (NDP forming)